METAYCRLCAESKPYNKLIDLQIDSLKRTDMIKKLTSINVKTDFDAVSLPKTVCFVCINTLDSAIEFVSAVEKAQSVLHNIFLIPVKEENDASENSLDDTQDIKYDIVKVEYELNSVNDYEGPDLKESPACSPNTKKIKTKAENNCFDSMPLAQLKLTWKDYHWTCVYCETQFPTAEELKNHSVKYHNCCNAYRCTDCNIRKLKLDRFIIHVKKHRKFLRLSCQKCFKRFSNPRKVNKHRITHITSQHSCPGCNTLFENQEELSKHTSTYYLDRRVRKVPLANIGDDGLSCIPCKKTFKNKGNLTTHLLTHTDRKRDHTCEKCGKCFLNKQNLAGHLLLHTDSRPYECEICKLRFKTSQQLRSHVSVHDNQKPHTCDQCGRSFRLQKQLQSHTIIHTDLLPYICTFCDKRFRFKTILNQHIRQHTGEKPYSCEKCQRDFTNWPNYNKHMKRRHGLDMAKKKHTPDGVYPINPATGELVVFQETNKTLEWKTKMMAHRKSGRPKTKVAVVNKNSDAIEKNESKVQI